MNVEEAIKIIKHLVEDHAICNGCEYNESEYIKDGKGYCCDIAIEVIEKALKSE